MALNLIERRIFVLITCGGLTSSNRCSTRRLVTFSARTYGRECRVGCSQVDPSSAEQGNVGRQSVESAPDELARNAGEDFVGGRVGISWNCELSGSRYPSSRNNGMFRY